METEIVVPPIAEDQGMLSRRKQEIRQLVREVVHHQNMLKERGLLILGRVKGSGFNRTADCRFRSTFGNSSIDCYRVWKLLQLDRSSSESMTPDHLLWGLMVLKVYAFEIINARMTGVDEKPSENGYTLQLKEL